MRGITVPVVLTVYSDRSFDFIVKSPPAAILIKQAAGIPLEKKKGGEMIPPEEKTKGSGKYKGFKVSTAQVRDIDALDISWPIFEFENLLQTGQTLLRVDVKHLGLLVT